MSSTCTDDSDDSLDEDDTSSDENQTSVDISDAEKHYIAKGNDKRVLICMSIGLKKEADVPYIDIEKDPWVKQPADVKKPTLTTHLRPEIIRRGAIFGSTIPTARPSQWSTEKCWSWLQENPLRDSGCISFLCQESMRVTKILEEALKEKDVESSAVRLGAWIGPKPYLRLVHCVIADDIRSHYLRRDAVLTRAQLDSRNSDGRQPNCYERIAAKWNDSSFNPVTDVSNCHYDFMDPIDIGHDSIKSLRPAVASDIKDRLTDIRARLIRMIKKWERSGQGDGGRHDEEEEQEEQADTDNPTSVQLGKLEGRSQFALDCRQNFLNDGNHGKLSSWYLYFWEQVDKFELLASTVTELATSIGAADANSVPAVVEGSRSVGTNSSRKKKRRRRLSDDSSGSSSASKGVTAKLTSVMEMLGRETKMSRISNHVGSLREEARSISAR
jgi:hypothetical protein